MRPDGLRRTAVTAALAVVGGTLAVAGVVAPASASITVSETYTSPSNGVFLVDGHGWGHGRGMSQYGALGAATLGKTATDIVSTYYPNTTSGTIANTLIRIKLSVDPRATIREFLPCTGLYALDLATNTKIPLTAQTTLWRVTVDSAGLHLSYITAAGTPSGLSKGYAGPLRLTGCTFVRAIMSDGSGRDYRNAIQVVKLSSTSLLSDAVMPMESYLRGVVPRESISSWPAAALQAQAIAARSYSAYKRAHVSTGQVYDICDTTACQVFMGSAKYTPSGTKTNLEVTSTDNAVAATADVVRLYQGAPIFAEFSASNGGWSTAGSFPYLVAKADPWDGVTGSSVHSWTASLPVTSIEAAFPQIGSFRSLTITQRDGNGEWGGRVEQVVLHGVNSSGAATTYTTTGAGIYNAHPWPNYSNGLRSTWFHIVPEFAASVVSRSATHTLVLPPGIPTETLTTVFKNVGSGTWPVSGLHLALSSPAGGPDPLSHNSTRPGAYVKNLTHPGASSVVPGDEVEFQIPIDATGQKPGTVTTAYRVQIGTAALFGSPAAWSITIVAPVFTAAQGASPALVSTTWTGPSGEPPALFADRRTVVVARTGTTTVRLTSKNTGNVTWPVGSTTPIELGTSNPRDRVSPSATSAWISTSRAARLVASAGVGWGSSGTFDVVLGGNSHSAGVTTEAFEPVWQGQSWLSGDRTSLTVVRVDPNVSRAAVTDLAPATGFTLVQAPTGRINLTIRLRNVGGQPWTVGQEQLRTSAAAQLAYHWTSSTRPPAMSRNVTRPGQSAVYPGEVGEWIVPLYGGSSAPGTYTMSFRPYSPSGTAYGPTLSVSAKVVAAVFTYQLYSVHSAVSVPHNGTAATWFYVKNTGNVSWPVGTTMRSTVVAGSSPSYYSGWYSKSRPGSLTNNSTSPGSIIVRPGEIARFVVVLAGNGRAPVSTSEVFGMSWDGWRSTTLRATLAYRIV